MGRYTSINWYIGVRRDVIDWRINITLQGFAFDGVPLRVHGLMMHWQVTLNHVLPVIFFALTLIVSFFYRNQTILDLY